MSVYCVLNFSRYLFLRFLKYLKSVQRSKVIVKNKSHITIIFDNVLSSNEVWVYGFHFVFCYWSLNFLNYKMLFVFKMSQNFDIISYMYVYSLNIWIQYDWRNMHAYVSILCITFYDFQCQPHTFHSLQSVTTIFCIFLT